MPRNVKVKFEGDTVDLDRAFDKLGVQAKRSETAGRRIAGGLGKIGDVAGGVQVIRSFSGQIIGAIDAATDLGEQLNKVGVVFRESASGIIDWSKSTATGFGISRREALQSASIFGNMLVPMGVMRHRAASMAKGFVELAADMASFNNAAPVEVLESLRSGLAGETEPLRRFGVFLSAARVNAEALSMGLVDAKVDTKALGAAQEKAAAARARYAQITKKFGVESKQALAAEKEIAKAEGEVQKALKGSGVQLSSQQKAMATYSIIMKDTKDAQGDFARTSDSLANRQRILRAQFDNLSANIAVVLLPALQVLAGIFSQLTAVFDGHAGILKAIVAAIVVFGVAVLAVNGSMKVYGASATAISRVNAVLSKAFKAAAVAVRMLNLALLANPFVLIAALIIALGVALVIAYKKSETFRRIVNAVFEKVKAVAMAVFNFLVKKIPAAFEAILNWVRANWPLIAMLISGPFAPIVALATDAFGIRSRMVAAFRTVKNAVVNAISTAVHAILSFPGRVASVAGRFAAAVVAPIKARLENLVEFIRKIGTRIQGIFHWLVGALAGPVNGIRALLGSIADVINSVAGAARDAAGAIQALLDIAGKVKSIGGSILGKIPGFAEGGIVRRPTFALVGEKGPEAVIPLTNQRRAREIMEQAGLAATGGPTSILSPRRGVMRAGGGAAVLQIHFHGGTFIGSNPRAVARDLAGPIRRELNRTGVSNVSLALP